MTASTTTPTTTVHLEQTIYDAMLKTQVKDFSREHWARFISMVSASVIETFKAQPELLNECLKSSYEGNVRT